MADRLHFEPETHKYTLLPSGIVLPSVSEVLKAGALVDLSQIPRARLEFARDRGHAVHKACELFDLKTLDEDDLDEQLVPYLQAWALFTREWQPTWTDIEQPGYHKKLLYAGTPDRTGIVRYLGEDIRFKGTQKRIKLDMKATYALNPAVQVQLSGYDLMDDDGPCDELWSVRLKKDGTYERKVHPAAHSTFLSCLNILNWKRKNA